MFTSPSRWVETETEGDVGSDKKNKQKSKKWLHIWSYDGLGNVAMDIPSQPNQNIFSEQLLTQI